MSAPSERDREMAGAILIRIDEIAVAIASARAEGFRAGIEAAAKEIELFRPRVLRGDASETPESAMRRTMWTCKELAAAIRALARINAIAAGEQGAEKEGR